ncbi:MAG TPA: hypothetical protein VK206_21075 [Anaerolineales bacterium]|nr:hypothetical protein [Anaerolineales bacterium]
MRLTQPAGDPWQIMQVWGGTAARRDSVRAFRQFAWPGIGSVKVALSRPTSPDRLAKPCRDHQPFTRCYAIP